MVTTGFVKMQRLTLFFGLLFFSSHLFWISRSWGGTCFPEFFLIFQGQTLSPTKPSWIVQASWKQHVSDNRLLITACENYHSLTWMTGHKGEGDALAHKHCQIIRRCLSPEKKNHYFNRTLVKCATDTKYSERFLACKWDGCGKSASFKCANNTFDSLTLVCHCLEIPLNREIAFPMDVYAAEWHVLHFQKFVPNCRVPDGCIRLIGWFLYVWATRSCV